MTVAIYGLFAWMPHEARGGFDDVKCGYATIEICKFVFESLWKSSGGDLEGHIVDLARLKIVLEPMVLYHEQVQVGVAPPPPRVEWMEPARLT